MCPSNLPHIGGDARVKAVSRASTYAQSQAAMSNQSRINMPQLQGLYTPLSLAAISPSTVHTLSTVFWFHNRPKTTAKRANVPTEQPFWFRQWLSRWWHACCRMSWNRAYALPGLPWSREQSFNVLQGQANHISSFVQNRPPNYVCSRKHCCCWASFQCCRLYPQSKANVFVRWEFWKSAIFQFEPQCFSSPV